ncbi:SAM hydrolase/SAM-dependent halogenase family protein [Nafulsella turpanensis]|uniref:SAM hydrolase/SAM-dependent halogenase family protein n=1 Tax=Nafulsella turpanensis TaxID=1265690 RepID=UPI000347C61F|nr:SAM-dependent chlorinase/fluorinase [Nafulsella turpanensis]
MAIITFISDFGAQDHYTAAVKARILSENPSQVIVDISHQIEHFNIAHGSFVLGSVFREFPPGSIHLVAVHATGGLGEAYIAVKLEGHYFVGTDNGLIGLLSEQEPEQVVILGTTPEEKELARLTSFPARDVMAFAAARLAAGIPMNALGEETSYFNRMIGRKPRASRKSIAGHVIHVDHYGNLITNIERHEFEFLLEDKFRLQVGRENLQKIHKAYNHVDAGEIFALFNSQGLLELGINCGNAAELLGLGFDSPVTIHFITEESAIANSKESNLPLKKSRLD